MAEYILTTPTAVAAGANVPFTDVVCQSCSVKHRAGSGVFTLRGGNGCHQSRFFVAAHLNVVGVAEAEQFVLTLDGEPLPETLMSTNVAAGDVGSLNVQADICTDCPCAKVGIRNASGVALTVNTASIIIDREV